MLDVSTKGLPPGLLLSLCASACFDFVTIPARRAAEHALPAAAVVVLELPLALLTPSRRQCGGGAVR